VQCFLNFSAKIGSGDDLTILSFWRKLRCSNFDHCDWQTFVTELSTEINKSDVIFVARLISRSRHYKNWKRSSDWFKIATWRCAANQDRELLFRTSRPARLGVTPGGGLTTSAGKRAGRRIPWV